MIITVKSSQSEDIAAFAMVKQYRMQALNVTLNGGTGSSAWQAVQGGEGYTQTVVTPVTGIELVYEDPNAIVSYTVENDDTSNYDAASNAGIILSSIEPTTNAWTYTCVFHADSVPVSSVDIDLLVYGNIARGTEQQGSPATAEEITAQVLAGLETRVTALEEEMPDKADKATTYTKTEIDTALGAKADDNAVVHLAGARTIPGAKTFENNNKFKGQTSFERNDDQVRLINPNLEVGTMPSGSSSLISTLLMCDKSGAYVGYLSHRMQTNGRGQGRLVAYNYDKSANAEITINCDKDGTRYGQIPNRAYTETGPSDIVNIALLDGYLPMVRTTGNQDITGFKNNMGMGIANLVIGGSTARWIRLAYTTISDGALSGYILPDKDTGRNASMDFNLLGRWNAGVFKAKNLLGSLNTALYALTYDGTTYELWYHYPENTTNWRVTVCIRGGNAGRDFILDGTTTKASLDAADYTWLINPTLESTDVVHRSGDEDISGIKTFTGQTLVLMQATSGEDKYLSFKKNDGTVNAYIQCNQYGSIDVHLGSGAAFRAPNQRTYWAANTTDVATIGTLDAYTPMVRTTGNQEIAGVKTHTGQYISVRSNNYTDIVVKRTDLDINNPPASTAYQAFLSFQDKNNQGMVVFEVTQRANGTTAFRAIVRNADGTSKYVTLAEGNA